jgi:hypothetical protein
MSHDLADMILAVFGVLGTLFLVPSIITPRKPHTITNILNLVKSIVIVFCMYYMGAIWSSAATIPYAFAWAVLSFQTINRRHVCGAVVSPDAPLKYTKQQ